MAFKKTGWVPVPRQPESAVGDLQARAQPTLYDEAARAVESLLRNPIQFVPATKRTYDDMKTTSPLLKSNVPPELSTMPKDSGITGAEISVRPEEPPLQDSISQPPEISARWQRQSASPSPPKGFSNAHVMCYRNSMIQALLHIPKLVNWLEDYHDICPKENRCTICAFQRLSLLYWQTHPNSKDVNQSMASLTANLKTTATLRTWRWSRQQDANEFYMFLVNAMIERHSSSEKTLKTLLGHQTARTTICDLNCHRSRVVSPFEYRLGVPIRKDVRLEDILKAVTFAPAKVSDYECEKCKKKGKATQHARLTTTPDILEIDFLRFQQTGHGVYRKNSLHVPFSSSLDISPFAEGKSTLHYRLLSVVQHMGSFANGHYRCIAKSPSGVWEELDDSSVRRSRISEAINPGGGWTPYSLFYARVEDDGRLDGHVNGVNGDGRVLERESEGRRHSNHTSSHKRFKAQM